MQDELSVTPDRDCIALFMKPMEEIRRQICDRVRRRLVEEAMKEPGNTERFDRVLALWIDVQRAIHLRERKGADHEDCTPWNRPDKRVRDAWDALTHPMNLLALESLWYQLPEGPQIDTARKALQVCRERSKEK